MKRIVILPIAMAALSLSACGLRGDLERPEPLWGDPEEIEPANEAEAVQTSELRPRTDATPIYRQSDQGSYRDPETGRVIWLQNENGGDKPVASPVDPVEDAGGLPPLGE